MNREELAQYDGQDGRKAYVAVNGVIYDFSGSPLWKNGHHQDQHKAGTDLTEDLKSAPHVRAVIERYPVVGTLDEEPSETKAGAGKWMALAAGVLALLIAYLILR